MARAAYILKLAFRSATKQPSSTEVMDSLGANILPRSLLDTDLYKARKSDNVQRTVITQLSSAPTAHDAASCAASFPRRPINIPVHPPRRQHILHSPVLRAIRCDHTSCARIPAPTPISLRRHNLLDARIFRPVFDARGAYLATSYVPVFQTFVPRLLGRLSLQAISGPGVLRATRPRQ